MSEEYNVTPEVIKYALENVSTFISEDVDVLTEPDYLDTACDLFIEAVEECDI